MVGRSKLASNTVIYAIGNFGTKILSYVMVLVYSYYITPEELGYYDDNDFHDSATGHFPTQ